jgi:hypothetical protein
VPTLQATPFDLNISGVITLSAIANGTPALGGANPSQQFETTHFTFTTTSAQTVGGVLIPSGANLLTGTATPSGFVLVASTLSGPDNGSSATFSGSDVTPPPGFANMVTYTSDYLNFTGATENAYAYSFTNVTPFYSIGGSFPFQFINPFTAAGTGTFSANAVAEPNGIVMMAGMGLCGSLLAFRRMRRR